MKSIYAFLGAITLGTTTWFITHTPSSDSLTPLEIDSTQSSGVDRDGGSANPTEFTAIPKIHHQGCKSCSHDTLGDKGALQLVATERSQTWPVVVTEHLVEKYKVSRESIRHLNRAISYTEFEQLSEEQLERVIHYAASVQNKKPNELLHLCWAVDTAPPLRDAMDRVRSLAIEEGTLDEDPQFVFQAGDRWNRTATDGFVSPGDSVTITWGFVADGTSISAASGFTAGTSNLIATLNATYGASTTSSYEDAPWFELFETAFEYWADVTGNVYVYVDYDNGVQINGSSSGRGIIDVRPDVRIGGKTLDGNSNVLAYNYFPDGGDMVIDTADSSNFTNTTTTKARFRNVVAHEHGHGLGLSHVCPVNRTKLMEPSVTTRFVGVQFDDMITVQEIYGDALERSGSSKNNETTGTANDLGTISNNFTRGELSISTTGDTDYYKFNLPSSKLLSLRLAPTSQAAYLEGPQQGSSCSTGTSFDPSIRQNLAVRILAPDGSTILATANGQPIGTEETISDLQLSQSGQDYFIEVTGGGENSSDNNNAQVYSLIIDVEDPPVTVSVSATDTVAMENDVSNTGEFTITSSVAPSANLDVLYSLSGSASSGSDFQALAGSATINASQQQTTVTVTPILDSLIEGDENLTLTLSPSANYMLGTDSAELTIKDLPFDEWRNTFFGSSTTNIGESEDFDFDGLQNLIEYASGEDPTLPSPILPPATLQNGGTQLVLTYQEDTTLTDIQYVVEVSPTLGANPNPWTTTGVTLSNGPLLNGKRTVTATANVSGERQFMRLRVLRN